MVRKTKIAGTVDGVSYYEFAGKSTDTKPTTTDISTGSLFLEVDTGDVYAYDEEGAVDAKWLKVAALGGDS